MTLELRQLRHFVAIVECGSFSAASDRVYASQSALTRSMQQLEEALGGPLLQRGARKTTTTGAGDRLLEYARMIIKDCDAAAVDLRALHEGAGGCVSVGVDPLLAPLIAARIVACVTADSPRIALRLVEANSRALTEMVAKGELAAAVVHAYQHDLSANDLPWEIMLEVDWIVAAAKTHPLSSQARVGLAALGAAQWVVLDDPVSMARHARFFASNGLPSPRAVRTNSLGLAVAAITSGGFLGFMPEPALRHHVRSGAVKALGMDVDRVMCVAALAVGEPGSQRAVERRVCAAIRAVHLRRAELRWPLRSG